ncbi:RTX toxin [Pseudomonas syringae pv. cilantro]|uniref:RTX toxin n=1 Tax=Pseudomonas syringae pv. cilantro TaxID=81035 RepID=A0A0N0X719_PSESX|nr:RTX toxin [Pseudomonas syringae pv. cilantro]
MLGDTGVVGVDVGCAEVAAGTADGAHAGAERRNAQADAEAEALFVDLVGVGVLQAFDVQVAANVGDDLLATRYSTFDLRVAARRQQQLIASFHCGVGVGQLVTVSLTLIAGDAQVQGKAVFAAAQREADTDAGAAAFAVGVLPAGVVGGQQVDVAVGHQAGVSPGLDLAALYGDVAVCTGAGRAQTHVVTGDDGRPGGAVAGLGGFAFVFLGAQRQADVEATCHVGVHRHRSGGVVTAQQDRGRCQRFHAPVVGFLRRLLHLLGGLNGADHRVGHGQGETGLFEQGFTLALAGVAGFDHIDGLPGDVDTAFWRGDLAAHLAVAFARSDQHVALGRPHRTRRCGLASSEVLDALLLRPECDCDAAAAEQAAFLHRLVVTFAAALGRGFDVDVVVSRQNGLVGGHHVAAADVDVTTGLNIGLLGTQRRALRLGLVDGVACGGGLAGEQAVLAFELVCFIGELGVLCSRQIHVAPGVGDDCALLAGNARAPRVEVLPGAQAHIALALDS